MAERINVADMGHTFANFKPAPGSESSLKEFQDIAGGQSSKPFVFCYGGVGNGKTHLLEAAVIRLNERGLFTRYYTWVEIIGNIRKSLNHSPEEPSAAVIVERFSRTPRLVIDDLGMGVTDTDWELAQLETIIAYRYRARLLTLIATNKDIKDLPPRIQSRLSDKEFCTMCLNRAADYRRSKSR